MEWAHSGFKSGKFSPNKVLHKSIGNKIHCHKNDKFSAIGYQFGMNPTEKLVYFKKNLHKMSKQSLRDKPFDNIFQIRLMCKITFNSCPLSKELWLIVLLLLRGQSSGIVFVLTERKYREKRLAYHEPCFTLFIYVDL